MIVWQTASCGWQLPPSIIGRITPHSTSLGEDHNSKFGVQFLLNAHHFCTTIKSKNCKLNCHESGTACIMQFFGMDAFGFILFRNLFGFWTWMSISFSMFGKFLSIISSNNILPLSFLFFFWDPYNVDVIPFDVILWGS